MRNLIIAGVVIAIAVLGYVVMTGDDSAWVEMEAVNEAPEAPAPEVVEEETEETIQDAVETVTEEASEAMDVATEDATEAVDVATEDAAEAVDVATEDATEAVSTAVDGAMESAGEAGETTSAALREVLTVEGFDLEAAKEAIDGSTLGTMTKTTLKTGIDAAKDNPEMLQVALEKAREALGL